MSTSQSHGFQPIALLDGQPADAASLAPLAFAGFAHFTAMQVRDRRVRGLDLHLARLIGASQRLHGCTLSEPLLRERLRQALAAGPADLSLLFSVHSAAGEFTGVPVEPRLLLRSAPPSDGPQGPLRLALVEHERWLPQIKHLGEGAKTFYLRQAQADGYDDAAFIDRAGRLGEASIWNLAFWDGDQVIWPQATVLAGTTQGILQRQLQRRGVPQCQRELREADLAGLRGAVLMNSWTPALAVTQLGRHRLPLAPEFIERLREAYAAEPWLAP